MIRMTWLRCVVMLSLASAWSYTDAASPLPGLRVDPPSWWVGFKDTQLQLVLSGKSITRYNPEISYKGITIERVLHVRNPDYLFIYLTIDPETRPGNVPIKLVSINDSFELDYSLGMKSRDPGHVGSFSSRDAIYLITPDRFANGDPANDDALDTDRVDRNDPNARHGGDLEGIRRHLNYIADMGFTQVWLNPVFENNMKSYSYHGYAVTDMYRIDPRFGSNGDYRALVTAARAKGIGFIMDVIPNHIGLSHRWLKSLPTRDWLHYPDGNVTNDFVQNVWEDPHASKIDTDKFAGGWFVHSMPDLNQSNPLVLDYLVQNALWWIEYAGLSGLRVDTYSYNDKGPITEWTRRILREYPALSMVGEVLEKPTIVAYWQKGKLNQDGFEPAMPSLMDFPLESSLVASLNLKQPERGSFWWPLYNTLSDDFIYANPGALVVFADNHDENRIFTQLHRNFALDRMAVAFILTVRGIPQVYYGTEVLMTNPGGKNDGVIRSDFPGGWAGDKVNAFTGVGLTKHQREMQAFIRKLLHWRRDKAVVHDGKLMHFIPKDGTYVYFRYRKPEDGEVMVAFNRSMKPVTLNTDRFEERLDGTPDTWHDVISDKSVSIRPSLMLAPESVTILESRLH